MKRKSKRRKSKKRSKSRKSKRKFDSGGCKSKASIAPKVEIIKNVINTNEFKNRADLENVILENIEIIGDYVFSYCENLENIIFSESLKTIGKRAFENTGLRCLTIPKNVKTIGEHAFSHCEILENVEILGNVEIITEGLFYDCKNLKSVTLPNSIRIIEQFAFYNCVELESIILPESVKIIYKNAFLNCVNLKSVFEPCLRIGEYSIKKISGPTSIVILKPKKGVSFELPTMILFGGNHKKDKPCKPCNFGEGCYNIYDDNFLKILNSVSSSKHLVDLYLEMYNDVIPEISSYIYDLHNVIKDCYRVKNIERYKNCKYKNMRFHYSDPRVPYLEDEKKYIEMMRPLHERTEFIHYSTEFETSFAEFLIKLKNKLKLEHCMIEFVKNIFDTIKNKKKDSLIFKQIEFNVYDFEFWSQIYLNILISENDEFRSNIKNYIDTNEKKFYYKIKEYMFAPILDIYFLSRNFKMKDDIKKPSVVFAYFGKGHVSNITRSLNEYMDLYEIFYKKNVFGKQCIEFLDYVNIF